MRKAFYLVAITCVTFVGSSLEGREHGFMQMSQSAPSAGTRMSTDGPIGVPQKLTGKAAWDRLIGNSISGRDDGKVLVEYYAADGIARSMTDNEISTGKWTVSGEAICFKYGGVANTCFTLEVFGDTVTFYNEKGDGGRYMILKGNPNGL